MQNKYADDVFCLFYFPFTSTHTHTFIYERVTCDDNNINLRIWIKKNQTNKGNTFVKKDENKLNLHLYITQYQDVVCVCV